MKLLIVDDDAPIHQGLSTCATTLCDSITEVKTAEDGALGLELARVFCPDIVVTDVRMANMTGIEMANALKEINQDVELIFVSGYAEKAYLKAAIRLSAVSYLDKPIDLDELRETLNQAAANVRQRREHARNEDARLRSVLCDRLVHGITDDGEFADWVRKGSAHINDHCLVLLLHSVNEEHTYESLLAMQRQLQEILAEQLYLDFIKNEEILIIVLIFSATDVRDPFETAYRIADAFAGTAIAAAGELAEGLKNCSESYETAQKALKQGIIRGEASLLRYSLKEGNVATVERMKAYLQFHCADPALSLAILCEKFHLSAPYVCAMFRKEGRDSVNHYLMTCRIEKAKRFLTQTALTTKEIATRVGYTDTNYFARVFHKCEGFSPQQYRRNHQ